MASDAISKCNNLDYGYTNIVYPIMNSSFIIC